MLAIKPDYSKSIKETLVACYQRNGFDFVTACQFASEFIRDLKKEKPGTVWTLNDPASRSVISIRRD